IEDAANRATRAAHDLAALARRTADRNQLYRAEAGVDAAVTALDQTVGQYPAVAPWFAENLSRVAYARQQLGVAILGSDRSPEQPGRVVRGVAGGRDTQAKERRAQTEPPLGAAFARDPGRSVPRFARAASRLHRDIDNGAAPASVLNDFAAVTQVWSEIGVQ